MVDATYIDNDRLQVVKNDEIVFDTDRPSVSLLPGSELVITGQTVTFPSPIQIKAYFRGQVGAGARCELWSTLIWQEWGPNETTINEWYQPGNPAHVDGPTTRNLPAITLGTVPAASDFLDIRARLTRTVTPPPFLGVQSPIPFTPSGQWINLTSGGSCAVEYHYPLIRHFDIRRTGNTIYLDRFQSCANTDSQLAPGGNVQRNISVNESGWNSQSHRFHGTGSASDGTVAINPKSNQNLVSLRDIRGPNPLGNNRRPGSGADECVSGGYPDLTSTYSVDLIITPGKYRT